MVPTDRARDVATDDDYPADGGDGLDPEPDRYVDDSGEGRWTIESERDGGEAQGQFVRTSPRTVSDMTAL